MRNSYAQLVVAPYAVRARPGAAVATPLHWDEVADPTLDPAAFNLRTTAAATAWPSCSSGSASCGDRRWTRRASRDS